MMSDIQRCSWANGNVLEQEYHDTEWGVPVHDDRLLFEMLTLEGAQAGLSWATVLAKRDGYKAAFDNFDVQKVAAYDQQKIDALLRNPAIVRNKLKVRSTVTNAQCIVELQREFGSFDAYIWAIVGGKPLINQWKCVEEVPSKTEQSDLMSKELKKRGFKFVGSTICYAFMQAVGMVNDHLTGCFRYPDS